MISFFGTQSVGVKLCPSDDYNDSAASFKEITETYIYYINQIMAREVGFINLSGRGCDVSREGTDEYFKPSPRPEGLELPVVYELVQQFGGLIKYPGSKTMLMVNHEYSVEAERVVREGVVDLVAFGRPFIYNPVCFLFLEIWR